MSRDRSQTISALPFFTIIWIGIAIFYHLKMVGWITAQRAKFVIFCGKTASYNRFWTRFATSGRSRHLRHSSSGYILINLYNINVFSISRYNNLSIRSADSRNGISNSHGSQRSSENFFLSKKPNLWDTLTKSVTYPGNSTALPVENTSFWNSRGPKIS